MSVVVESALTEANEKRNQHLREIIDWHFSPETGCPYWLEWARRAGWDPREEIKTYDDIVRFPHFDDETLRNEPHEVWIPREYQGKPYKIFETGGTTGLPKQRISWTDHEYDYTEFAETLDPEHFPRGGNWLMMGPTGPRRLRLTIEHLANVLGGSCYHLDLDPRWVKKVIAQGRPAEARAYMEHVVDQAVPILKHRNVSCLFTTPKLLEALGDKINVPNAGVRGVFLGGTSMTNQVVRFLVEEVLENRARLVPTYGNTLMGLACSKPLSAEEGYALTYYAPQPRAVLRVVDPDDTARTVEYGEWGRVELTTMTREFFMPRFLERDEAVRREPWGRFAWDGVGEVRPFRAEQNKVVEGVY
ncbi:MAG: AMP-binding protein [bacterium]|nr:AMP-binding protein [bacterium]